MVGAISLLGENRSTIVMGWARRGVGIRWRPWGPGFGDGGVGGGGGGSGTHYGRGAAGGGENGSFSGSKTARFWVKN